MRLKLFRGVIFLGILTLACQLFTPSTPASPPSSPDDHQPATPVSNTSGTDDLSIFREGLVLSQHHWLDKLTDASLYSINFVLGDNLAEITGAQQVAYTNRENLPLGEIQLHLFPNLLGGQLQLSSVTVDDQPVQPGYALGNSVLIVPLQPALQPGERITLGLAYTLTLPTQLETNYGVLAYYGGVLSLAHAYPMVAVYDDDGWNTDNPSPYGDLTHADASFFLVTLDAPRDLLIAASGREVERQYNGNRQVVRYAAGPVRDFYLAASADYTVQTETVNGITFNSYAFSKQEEGARYALDVTIDAIKRFGSWYTPYPYTEYDIVATPTFALGVEYPGIVAIAQNIYDPADRILLESVSVHEAAHQWFYNMVGNDQPDEPWLDESLSQFVTWQYYRDRYGEDGANGFEASLRQRWSRVEEEKIPIGLPVSAYDQVAYSAIVYGRGAFFFAALQSEISAPVFETFIENYVEEHAWKIASTQSLKTSAETHCRCNLAAFFEDWVY